MHACVLTSRNTSTPYFYLPYFHVSNSVLFLSSTPVVSFSTDVLLLAFLWGWGWSNNQIHTVHTVLWFDADHFTHILHGSLTDTETMQNQDKAKPTMTSLNGNIFRVTGPLCGEFTGHWWIPLTRPVTRSFDVFFDLCLNKRLNKQSWGWWFEAPSRSLCLFCLFHYIMTSL